MQTFRDLDLPTFYRNSIGVDKLFNSLQNHVKNNSGNYPPYDVIVTGDDTYVIKLAIAGFTEDDVNITAHNGQLVITGDALSADEDTNYLHNGISNRKFKREFTLAEYVIVTGATMKDGILQVELEHIVPDEMKPKQIEINKTPIE